MIAVDPGTDATFDVSSLWNLVVGDASSDATQPFTGPRALKLSTGAGAATASVSYNGASAWTTFSGDGRGSGWLYLSAWPAAQADIFSGMTSGFVANLRILMNTDGTLTFGFTGATFVTGTTVVPVNQKTRISWSFFISSTTVFLLRVFVNGIPQGSATAGTATSTSIAYPKFILSGAFGANVNAWWTHIYMETGIGTLLHDDIGDMRVVAKRPAGHFLNQWDTAIGANPANRWENVNERPVSQTNGWQQATPSAVDEVYSIEPWSAGDSPIAKDRRLHLGWAIAKTGATSSDARLIVNGEVSGVQTIGSTPELVIFATAGAYTADLAMGIGMRASPTEQTFLYDCGIIVAYLEPHNVARGSRTRPRAFAPGVAR